MDQNYSIAKSVEFGGAPRPGLLLRDVYRVYSAQFRRWFAITAPTSLLASAILLMANRRISEIYASFPMTQVSFHMLEVAEAGALRYGSFFISWFLGCLALAAIATVVYGLDKSDRDDVWISDSFQRARASRVASFGGVLHVWGIPGWSASSRASRRIVGSSRVDLQACKLEYSIVSPK